MRWKALFDDLEAQAEEAGRAEWEGEVRDRTRREAALVGAGDRLRAAAGADLRLDLDGPGTVTGRLLETGPDWLLLEERSGHEALVPLSAVLAVSGLNRHLRPAQGEVGRRLDLRWALRGLARDRRALHVVLRNGLLLSGTLDRVGADHVDLAEHPQGEPRRAAAVRGIRLLPLTALAVLRTAEPG